MTRHCLEDGLNHILHMASSFLVYENKYYTRQLWDMVSHFTSCRISCWLVS